MPGWYLQGFIYEILINLKKTVKERAYYKMQKEHIIKRTKNKKGLVNKHLKGVGWEIIYI